MSSAAETLSRPSERVQAASKTKTMVCLGMLAAIAYAVMLLSKLLPQVVGILQFDLKDTVICIGGFIFGPAAAAMVSIVVALLEMLTVSDTGIWGFLMNVLATCAFCCTASFLYKRKHSILGAVLGLFCGTAALTIVMLLWNWLVTPIYWGGPRAAVAAMLLPVFLPFNLVKGGMNTAVILILYKPVVGALRKARLVAPAQGKKGGFRFGLLLFALALLATFVFLMLTLSGVI